MYKQNNLSKSSLGKVAKPQQKDTKYSVLEFALEKNKKPIHYCIDIAHVVEIADFPKVISEVSSRNDFIYGVINIRKSIFIPLYNIAYRLNLDHKIDPTNAKVIVLYLDESFIAVLVNSVRRIHSVSESKIMATNPFTSTAIPYTSGYFKHNARIIQILSVKTLLCHQSYNNHRLDLRSQLATPLPPATGKGVDGSTHYDKGNDNDYGSGIDYGNGNDYGSSIGSDNGHNLLNGSPMPYDDLAGGGLVGDNFAGGGLIGDNFAGGGLIGDNFAGGGFAGDNFADDGDGVAVATTIDDFSPAYDDNAYATSYDANMIIETRNIIVIDASPVTGTYLKRAIEKSRRGNMVTLVADNNETFNTIKNINNMGSLGGMNSAGSINTNKSRILPKAIVCPATPEGVELIHKIRQRPECSMPVIAIMPLNTWGIGDNNLVDTFLKQVKHLDNIYIIETPTITTITNRINKIIIDHEGAINSTTLPPSVDHNQRGTR